MGEPNAGSLRLPAPARALHSLSSQLLRAKILGGILGGLLALLGLVGLHVVLGANFHTVLPGRCFRSAQPSAGQLEEMLPRLHIRTVVNLRGRNENYAWYREECAAAERHGVTLVDVSLSAQFLPSRAELQKLLTALTEADEPLLLHCCWGSDRSGLAAAFYLLLKTDADPEQARAQLSLRYGHFPSATNNCPGDMMGLYADWLEREGLTHRPAHLLRWAREGYMPSAGQAKSTPAGAEHTLMASCRP